MKNVEQTNHKHHILPLWIYLAVGSALLVLTGLTIAAAQINFTALTGFSEMNFVIAMVIATIKATLVALFFMHLFYDNKFYLFALISSLLCLMIFITLTLFDTQWRGKINAIEARPIVEQTTKDKFIGKSSEHNSAHEEPEHK